MSGEEKKQRKRVPPGFYASLSGVKGRKDSKMASGEEGELATLTSKSKRKKASKAGSKKSVSSVSQPPGDLENQLKDLELVENEVDKELDALSSQDAHSKILHRKAMEGEIQFIEDLQPEEDLEHEDVWGKETEMHRKEEEILAKRMIRLERKEQLFKVKGRLRQQRIQLVRTEKQIEEEDRRQQMKVRAEWLAMQRQEEKLETEWSQQEAEIEDFHRKKRVEGWVAKTVTQVSEDICDKAVRRAEKPTRPSGPQGMYAKEATRLQHEHKESKAWTGAPTEGRQHLEKMGLMPSYGLEPSIKNLPPQTDQKINRNMEPWDQLSIKEEPGKDIEMKCSAEVEDGDRVQKTGEKTKVKSGKFAKSHRELVREESWPHVNVLRQYAKRTSFDAMDYETFVAGESRIISSMWHKDVRRAHGRLKVLCKVAHWMCKCRDWVAVRNIYEAIIESIEMGEADWQDGFQFYETLLPPSQAILEKLKKEEKGKEKEKEEKKKTEVFWCKEYQKGMCTEGSPHSFQLKPDEKPVMVAHFCASCWQKDKKKKDHPEGDTSCPHRKI